MFSLICKEGKYTAPPDWHYAVILHAFDKEVGRIKKTENNVVRSGKQVSVGLKMTKTKRWKEKKMKKSKENREMRKRQNKPTSALN